MRLCNLAPISLVLPHYCNLSRAVSLCMDLWDRAEATTSGGSSNVNFFFFFLSF